MSKVEELAFEKYPPHSVLIVPARGGGYYADSHMREGFIEGYHQAEKDLELTWEDIKKLGELMSTKRINDGLFDKEDYEEVLKRFNKEMRKK